MLLILIIFEILKLLRSLNIKKRIYKNRWGLKHKIVLPVDYIYNHNLNVTVQHLNNLVCTKLSPFILDHLSSTLHAKLWIHEHRRDALQHNLNGIAKDINTLLQESINVLVKIV